MISPRTWKDMCSLTRDEIAQDREPMTLTDEAAVAGRTG